MVLIADEDGKMVDPRHLPKKRKKKIDGISRAVIRQAVRNSTGALRKTISRLEKKIRVLKIEDQALLDGIPDTDRERAYRGHIAKLHAQIQRMKDPSIPQRARRHIRRAASRIEDMPGLQDSEKLFFVDAMRHGFEIYRAGWPDFLLIHKETGQPRFIEVKSPTDSLSDNQKTMFAALEQCGIKVEVYRSGKREGKRARPWRQEVEQTTRDEPAQESGAQLSQGPEAHVPKGTLARGYGPNTDTVI